MMYVKPKTMYVQGIPRTWLKRSKEEFFQKELQHIGQQAILKKEVYAADSLRNDDFGWQDRYDEYRHALSTVAGEFRTTLNFWHMARIIAGDVTLNEDFIKSQPTTRIYAATASDPLYIMVNHSIQARRQVSKSGGISFVR